MTKIAGDRLERYRQQSFRTEAERRLGSLEEAIAFVNERGFVTLWPIKGITLPSLWAAVAGERPVADAHDDPGHVTWSWKDQMLGRKEWYYAKMLRGKATFIAPAILPAFYALSENYGDPENDYRQLYEDGLLSREAMTVYEALLTHGALDTIRLRREAGMSSNTAKSAFDRALTILQRDFKILPVGVSEAGAWRYSFVYDAVHHVYPELPEQARPITRRSAREHLAACYLEAMGAATVADLQRLFQWAPADVIRTLDGLVEAEQLRAGCRVGGQAGEYYAVPALVEL